VHPCISADSSVTAPCRLFPLPFNTQVIRAMSANAAIVAIRTVCVILRARQLDKVPAWLAAQSAQLRLGSCKKGTDVQLQPMFSDTNNCKRTNAGTQDCTACNCLHRKSLTPHRIAQCSMCVHDCSRDQACRLTVLCFSESAWSIFCMLNADITCCSPCIF